MSDRAQTQRVHRSLLLTSSTVPLLTGRAQNQQNSSFAVTTNILLMVSEQIGVSQFTDEL
jgi:hypothetical protein